MKTWAEMVEGWRTQGYVGWHEHGRAYCLECGRYSTDGTLIRPQQREAVQAARLRCCRCAALLVPGERPAARVVLEGGAAQ